MWNILCYSIVWTREEGSSEPFVVASKCTSEMSLSKSEMCKELALWGYDTNWAVTKPGVHAKQNL